MNNTLSSQNILWIVLLLIIVACKPYNKQSYITSFENFVTSIEKKGVIKNKEWPKIKKQYENFSQKYYKEYSDEFTMDERAKVGLLITRFYKAVYDHNPLKAAELAIESDIVKRIFNKIAE